MNDFVARLRHIPVAVLSDVLVKAGCPDQVLSHKFVNFDGISNFVGPAFCMQGETTTGSSKKKDIRFDMYRDFPSGAVLIMATGGYDQTALLGENMVVSLKARGCQGIVLDGGYRDRSSIAELGVPVRARFLSPVASSGRFAFVDHGKRVVLPGQTKPEVEVNPGDLVVGDDEGIIIIPKRGIASVVEDAEHVMRVEEKTRDMIQAGEDSEKAYALNDRFSKIRKI